MPGGDRDGEKELQRSGAPVLGPQAHADRRHDHEVQPRMPAEERGEARFAALEEIARGEGKESGQQKEDHQEDVRDRRGEVRAQLALDDGEDGFHDFACGSVSGSGMRRNTSSSSPRSLYMPCPFQLLLLTRSTTACASSADFFLSAG